MSAFIFGVATCLIGVIGSWFFTKRSLRRKIITNFTLMEFEIGKSLCDDFKNLSFQISEKQIDNDLRIYKGVLMNTGGKDISAKDNKITIVLPDDCVIKDSHKKTKIKGTDDVVISQSSEEQNELTITFGLLQTEECIEYDILYESTNTSRKSISDKIKFSYRIEDVCKQIRTKKLPNVRPRKSFIRSLIACVIMFVVFASVSIMFGTQTTLIRLTYTDLKGNPVDVYNESDSTVYVCGEYDMFRLRGEYVNKKHLGNEYTIQQREYKALVIVSWIIAVICLLTAVGYSCLIYVFKKDQKMYDKIKNEFEPQE